MFNEFFNIPVLIQVCFIILFVIIGIFAYFTLLLYLQLANWYKGYNFFMKLYTNIEKMPNQLELNNPIYSVFKNCILAWSQEIEKSYEERIDNNKRIFQITKHDWLEMLHEKLEFLKNLLYLIYGINGLCVFISIIYIINDFNIIILIILTFFIFLLCLIQVSFELLRSSLHSWDRRLDNFFNRLINDLMHKL